MSSDKRRWIWVSAVALVAAAFWWRTPAEPAPEEPVPEEPREAMRAKRESPPAPPEEAPRPEAAPVENEEAPSAPPLPRDEIELPPTSQQSDAGVPIEDASSTQEKRERMISIVLDRLEQDLRDAEEADDEATAARLRVRIERMKRQRDELASP